MDTYYIRCWNQNGSELKPQTIRAQSIINLRKRLLNESKGLGGYVLFEITKSGSATINLLEKGWGGGYLWYVNARPDHRRWDKVQSVGKDGRLI